MAHPLEYTGDPEFRTEVNDAEEEGCFLPPEGEKEEPTFIVGPWMTRDELVQMLRELQENSDG